MKHLLTVSALLFAITASAQSGDAAAPASPADAEQAVVEQPEKVVIAESDQDGIDRAIERSVTGFVEKVLDNVGDELSAEEKREILDEIRADFAEERGAAGADGDDESGGGLRIDIGSDHDSGLGFHEFMIATLAITLIFGTPILVVIAVLYAGYRKRRLVQETISQYLASGKEVPPEILESIHGAEPKKNYLQKGFVMVGAGIGIFLCFAIMGEISIGSLGLIPLFIGLAQLLIWKLETRGHDARG